MYAAALPQTAGEPGWGSAAVGLVPLGGEDGEGGEVGGQAFCRGPQERTVRRNADRQQQRALGPATLGGLQRTGHGAGMAGDDELAR